MSDGPRCAVEGCPTEPWQEGLCPKHLFNKRHPFVDIPADLAGDAAGWLKSDEVAEAILADGLLRDDPFRTFTTAVDSAAATLRGMAEHLERKQREALERFTQRVNAVAPMPRPYNYVSVGYVNSETGEPMPLDPSEVETEPPPSSEEPGPEPCAVCFGPLLGVESGPVILWSCPRCDAKGYREALTSIAALLKAIDWRALPRTVRDMAAIEEQFRALLPEEFR